MLNRDYLDSRRTRLYVAVLATLLLAPLTLWPAYGLGWLPGPGWAMFLAAAWAGVSGSAFLIGWRCMRDVARRIDADHAHCRKLSLIAERTNKKVVIANAQGQIDWVNKGFEQVSGYTLGEVRGKTPGSVLGGFAKDSGVRTRLRKAVRDGADTEVELLNYRKNGTAYWARLELRALRDTSGELTGFLGIESDITKRKRTEFRLQESEARFKRAMNGSSDGLWDLDLFTGLIYVSDRCKELLGYPPCGFPSYVGHQFKRELIHPDDLHQVVTAGRRHLVAHEPFDVSVRLRRSGGDVRWFRIRAAAELTPGGEPRHLTGVLSDIDELKAAQAQLQWSAFHDPLTGLANRQFFLNRLNKVLQYPPRQSQTIHAVLSFDFDHFKRVNDQHGHHIGDELLCSIAQRLADGVREVDLAARFGGDEFLVLLHEVDDVKGVEQAAKRLSSSFSEPHYLSSNVVVTCTASIGIIVIDNRKDVSADTILREADAAMYQAKADTRGSYRFFDRELRACLAHRATLESDLRNAVYDDEFELVYQPVVDLGSGTAVGFEALIRWWRRGQELVSPADFIPIAEESGLILPIGRWVVDRACADLARWRRACQRAGEMPISVNVSRLELKDPGYQNWLIETIASHGLRRSDIVLEVTETALVNREVELVPAARGLVGAGFRLAMDDFGSGQSSLNSLVNLPISILKIDKMFIQDMCDDVTRIAIVNAVVVLAHHLKLKVVVEGIESPTEVALLQAMDCQFGQGFLFARPMSAEDAFSLIGNEMRLTHVAPQAAEPGRHAT